MEEADEEGMQRWRSSNVLAWWSLWEADAEGSHGGGQLELNNENLAQKSKTEPGRGGVGL